MLVYYFDAEIFLSRLYLPLARVASHGVKGVQVTVL